MSKPEIYYQNKFDMHSSLSGAQRWTPHAEYECINSYVELEDYEKAMKAIKYIKYRFDCIVSETDASKTQEILDEILE